MSCSNPEQAVRAEERGWALRSEGDVNLSAVRAHWHASLDDETRRVLREDASLFLHQSLSSPCLDVVHSAQGDSLHCSGYGTILDYHGNNAHHLGHAHPRVVEAVKAQMDTLAFCPRRFTNQAAIGLARKLVSLAPGALRKVLFAPGGAEAISMALKLARLTTRRYKTISFWDSFHGATLDTISLGGERMFRDGLGPLVPGCLHAPSPVVPPSHRESDAVEAMRSPDYLEYLMRKEGDVAAVLAEPFRYSFALHPPADYWKDVRRICRKHGALLIFDEIPVSLGRTGYWFASEMYDVEPDMVVLGKGLGGGVVPLAALLVDAALDKVTSASLGHFTHEKNPLGAAAGLAMIEVIEQDDLLRQTRCNGLKALAQLKRLQAIYSCVGMVSGIGLQLAVEIVDPQGGASSTVAETILYAALARGLSFKVAGGNILSLAPPLTTAGPRLAQALEVLEAAMASSTQPCAGIEPSLCLEKEMEKECYADV